MIGLKAQRLDRLMSVPELAEAANVPERTIYRLEAGGGARIETLKKLSEFFKVTPSSLLRGTPDFQDKAAA